MASLQDLLSVQVGKQSVFATAVSGTAKVMGVTDCSFEPINEAMVFNEIRGSLAPSYNAALTKIGAQGKLSMYGFYEDINYFMEGLLAVVTPGGAGPYTRTASAPLSAVSSPRIQTLIWGDGTNCYKATGMIVTKATIKGASNQPLMADFDWIAHDVSTGSLAALSDRSQNPAMAQHALLYVDAWGGTIGSTALSAIAWDFQLVIDSKRNLDWYLGSLSPGNYHEKVWSGSLDLNLELQTTSKAYLDEIIGGSAVHQRQVRVKYTSDSNHISQFDFAGTALKAPKIFDYRDKVVGVKINYGEGTYNSGLANWFVWNNTCQVSALP